MISKPVCMCHGGQISKSRARHANTAQLSTPPSVFSVTDLSPVSRLCCAPTASVFCAYTPHLLRQPTHTTHLAEVFPTHVRTTFQGISSASGKVGAIAADVLFSYVTQRTTFFLSAAFGLFGALVTWVFLPGEASRTRGYS